MKRLLLLFSLLFILAPTVFSQEKVLDNTYLKCQYTHIYLKDTLEKSSNADLFILEVGKSISKCYSYYTFQLDSLIKTPDGDKVWKEIFNKSLIDRRIHKDREKWLNSFPHKRSTAYIYKNYPEGRMSVTDAVGGEHVIYEDTLNAQNWQIDDSTKNIWGYECQKAVCNFRGRRWTAWFALDIPISDGPWKLGGLPGLILEAYDAGKHYYFSIVGLEKVYEEPIVFSESPARKDKYREIDRRELLKTQMQRLSNSRIFMSAETGVSFGSDEPVYRDLIERDYR